MEDNHLKEFSPDEKLFAIIQNEGKLKIWDVETNQLKQEYVPNLHLSTPVTAMKWIRLNLDHEKRKSRHSDAGGSLYIILGTNRGGLALFSYASAKIEASFKGEGHLGTVTSIDHDNSQYVYSCGSDGKVIKWNIQTSSQESYFNCGPEKPTAICVLENGDKIATASKGIKVWEDSKLIQNFIGHSKNVTTLKSFEYDDETFILSASKSDRHLSLWKLSDDNNTSATSTFTLLIGSPNCVNFQLTEDRLQIACICRSDSMMFFDTNLQNVKSKKPIKQKFMLEIASDADNDEVDHVPINAVLIVRNELLIGYGDMIMKFETISSKQSDKSVILVRKDPMKMDVKKKNKKGELDEDLNTVTPLTDKNAEILSSVSATKRVQKPVELPLETRLDNLAGGESKRPNAKKMTHQLIQGLQARDANVIRNILRQNDNETVKLTVKFLPSQYVMPLVDELSKLMSGRSSSSEIALVWLRNLIQIHASSLLSYGADNLNATFGPLLGIIDQRTQSLPMLARLKGRLELLVSQMKQNCDPEDEIRHENLLVYEDSDDDSNNMDVESNSSDEDIFDEFEDEEEKAKEDFSKDNGDTMDYSD
ncbi:CLUMA_CG001657, isoform A [Clunio marinus]|uniref:CLUMA_CG001657, isoform A n=1 Tax=Clunio marinus TaxID=568069 RepID=A0A1J1HN27_9DIPT|nr:CLUMA_CG001657, isoform A [Clunio marinus]